MSNWDTSTGQVSRVPLHECDHTNCIPRSELPGLPDGWEPGSFKEDDGCVWGMRHGRLCDFALDCGTQYAIFLVAMLNTCYPAPTATKEG